MKAADELFEITTPDLRIAWSGKPASDDGAGTLIVRAAGTEKPRVAVRGDERTSELHTGPILLEDRSYLLWIESKVGVPELRHRDPRLVAQFVHDPSGRSLVGSLEFRSAAGFSDFEIWVDGRLRLSFTVEVFPSKLDYKDDFRAMLAEVQATSTGLALDLLAATYLPASAQRSAKHPGANEWTLLVNATLDELILAFREIERAPIWSLDRELRDVRPDMIRRPTAALQNRLVSKGLVSHGAEGIAVSPTRALRSTMAGLSLDGPEHRWLRQKLTSIVRRLGALANAMPNEEGSGERARATRRHFETLAERLRPLLGSEPLRNASGAVPGSFASLKLMSRSGYREAYRLLGLLDRGLSLEGGPVKADLREISALYEYWCFLSLVRLTSELLDRSPSEQSVVKVGSRGVRVDLERGHASTVRFLRDDGLTVELAYNRKFGSSRAVLFDQIPDVLISIRDRQGAEMHLVVEAKYRIDRSLAPERFGMITPPADAINALYRYRDAIVRSEKTRSVVEAVAAFPASSRESGTYPGSRLAVAIEEFGVGAIPFLPGNEDAMRAWLRRGIGRATWETAGGLPGHVAVEFTEHERRLAERIVLIDVVPSRDRAQRREFFMSGWHYVPLPTARDIPTSKAQRRRLQTHSIALFDGRDIGVVGEVDGVEIVRRDEIDSPFPSSLPSDTPCVLYRLKECRPWQRNIKLSGPFTNLRWTSGLGLELAASTNELLIELADEWRLYRALQARSIAVRLRGEIYREGQTGGHIAFEFDSTRIRLGPDRLWRVRRGDTELRLATIDQVFGLVGEDRDQGEGRKAKTHFR